MAIDAILTGGKRTRPLLCLLTYTAYTDSPDEKIADDLIFAVECFHKASLIHDDLEDQDDYRYDQKTVHIEKGLPLAVNLGDFLTGYGYKTISSLNLVDSIKSQLFSLFSSLHVESSLGQGEDLFHARENSVPDFSGTISIFERKTGSAIKASLQAGAIAAGAPLSELEILGDFSLLLGTAYQIFDDVTEFRGAAKDRNQASYPFLKSLAAEKKIAASGPDDWKSLIQENEIAEKAQTILDSYLEKIQSSLNKLQSTRLRLALLRIVNYIFKT
jgi:geranylgeranyl pyrophosphate synthase